MPSPSPVPRPGTESPLLSLSSLPLAGAEPVLVVEVTRDRGANEKGEDYDRSIDRAFLAGLSAVKREPTPLLLDLRKLPAEGVLVTRFLVAFSWHDTVVPIRQVAIVPEESIDRHYADQRHSFEICETYREALELLGAYGRLSDGSSDSTLLQQAHFNRALRALGSRE